MEAALLVEKRHQAPEVAPLLYSLASSDVALCSGFYREAIILQIRHSYLSRWLGSFWLDPSHH